MARPSRHAVKSRPRRRWHPDFPGLRFLAPTALSAASMTLFGPSGTTSGAGNATVSAVLSIAIRRQLAISNQPPMPLLQCPVGRKLARGDYSALGS